MTRRTLLGTALGAAVVSLGGCRSARAAGTRAEPPASVVRQPAPADGRSVETIDVGGVTRRYIRYQPPGHDPSAPFPLVLVLHGAGSSGGGAERLYGMSEVAAREGFVVAYPDAEGEPRAWNAGFNPFATRADDGAFLRALVEREAARRPIDEQRRFVCGHSSGAMMSYRLAGEASDLVAAVGIVAGSIGYRLPTGGTVTIPEPSQPVAVVHVHGTDDPLVPYQGGGGRRGGGFLSVAESMEFWVRHDGCDPTPEIETTPDGGATRQSYHGGRAGTDVTLWTIQGGGHEWPGWSIAPQRGAGAVSATDLIWRFFAAHPRQV
jgi:polyhydroxybutyrate depolymerase